MEKLFCSSINLVRNEKCTDHDFEDVPMAFNKIHWPILVKNVVNNFKPENLIPTNILSTWEHFTIFNHIEENTHDFYKITCKYLVALCCNNFPETSTSVMVYLAHYIEE
ncbi:hypothetical protein H5410_013224 [Solanum commersonii]|uniref:Uncharacterized protein n=1 Tax=Solanum commersonii TaxID=4109 RepID=A0A9J6ATY3_SOLCO|nr:hypothetical protein H5410_013224 [Solanum commersonii]